MIDKIIEFYNSHDWNKDIESWRRNVHREGHSWHLSRLLFSLFSVVQPKSYLEVGVCEGDSLLSCLLAANGCITTLYLVDNWGSTYGGSNRGSANHIQKLLEKKKQQARILSGDSKHLLGEIKEQFEVILVDADHTHEGALVDLNNAWNLLQDGGFLVFDDICHPGHKYLDDTLTEFLRNKYSEGYKFCTERIYEGYGVAIVYKGSIVPPRELTETKIDSKEFVDSIVKTEKKIVQKSEELEVTNANEIPDFIIVDKVKLAKFLNDATDKLKQGNKESNQKVLDSNKQVLASVTALKDSISKATETNSTQDTKISNFETRLAALEKDIKAVADIPGLNKSIQDFNAFRANLAKAVTGE